MRLALYEPDIPQNAGALIRLGACLGVAVDIIEPCGFLFSEAKFRRAGMDYLKDADIRRHASWAAFRQQAPGRLVLLTTKASIAYTAFAFAATDTLLLGRESAGVPDTVHEAVAGRILIPMRDGMRSINVAQAGAMVLGGGLAPDRRFSDSMNAADSSLTEQRQAQAKAWFARLRDSLIAAFEAIEDDYTGAPAEAPGRFAAKEWKRPAEGGEDGGGGTMALMKGRVFEKVGVNISTVHGRFDPAFAKEVPGAAEDPRYWAAGISLVAHMKNPRVPAAHFNTRHIVTTKAWFGGGGDLTPMLMEQRRADHPNTVAFHEAFRRACDAHGADYYARFSKWCDEYFFLKHRNETRGVGGIFYDYLESDWARDFSFTQDVGKAFLEAFPAIVRDVMNEPATPAMREEQLVRRGRYAEFNLVYDRGTRFGLMTGGNAEAILMSLPPIVHWP